MRIALVTSSLSLVTSSLSNITSTLPICAEAPVHYVSAMPVLSAP